MSKIKIITDESFFPNFKKSIHYISWTPYSTLSVTGYSRMTYVDAIVRSDLPDINPEELYRRIDFLNETGTLYPKVNITIMPSYRQPYSDEEIYRHFNDAMKAQNLYIHADNIIFDMRNYSYISPYTNQPNDKEYIRMIYHNHSSSCILGDKRNTYVIMLNKDAEEVNHLYCEDATNAEVDDLRLIR